VEFSWAETANPQRVKAKQLIASEVNFTVQTNKVLVLYPAAISHAHYGWNIFPFSV